MQTCYNCGLEVPNETLICPECGALVRRYTKPAAQPETVSQASAVREAVPRDALAGNRLHGPVKVWLIVLCAAAAYMAVSALSCVILAANPQFLEMMLSQPGMDVFEPLLGPMRDELPGYLSLFAAMTCVYAAKAGCHLWLLLRARRRPFMLSIAVSFIGILCAILLGGSLLVIVYLLDPIVTWMGLRHYWPQMPR